jgi:quercetin dioxygenase-like cupin family protein
MPNLKIHPIHLGLGATALEQPEFTGMDWYAGYGERNGADGAEGRLVSMHHFTESWAGWEMHPLGAEVVVCIQGQITLIQEMPSGRVEHISLSEGDYAINPPGVWHTADLDAPATALFITAGEGTQNKGR